MNQLNNKLHENIGIQRITMMCVLPKSSYLHSKTGHKTLQLESTNLDRKLINKITFLSNNLFNKYVTNEQLWCQQICIKKRVPKSNFHNFPPRQKEWKLQALLNLWHRDDKK